MERAMKSADTHTTTSADGTPIAYHTVGTGEGVIVVGGAMRTAEDYMPFTRHLGRHFQVHLMDRRGRGLSGGQGETHAIERECDDLQALQADTHATRVFGHSYGGLVVLETAKRSPIFTDMALYEPGVSIDNSIPTAWIPRYSRLLAQGDTRGAFAYFIQQSGHAPSFVEKMPLWYLKTVLRLVLNRAQWLRMEPLLHANIVEHEQVSRLNNTATTYGMITARVLLIAGSKSPAFMTKSLYALEHVLGDSSLEVLNGLDHNAPDERAPDVVADRVMAFMAGAPAHR